MYNDNLLILQRKLKIAEERFRTAKCNKCSSKYLKQALRLREQIYKLKNN